MPSCLSLPSCLSEPSFHGRARTYARRAAVCLALSTALAIPATAAAEREFELVSAPDGQAYAAQGQVAQPDGNGLYWVASAGVQTADPAPPDGAKTDWFLAWRSETGWEQRWVSPDPAGATATEMEPAAALPGLLADGVTFSALAGTVAFVPYFGLYRGTGGTGAGAELVSAAPGADAVAGLNETQWLTSEDLDTMVFSSSGALDAADTNGRSDLYVRRGDALMLISRRTDGGIDPSAAAPYLPFSAGNNIGAAAYYSFGMSGFPRSQGASPVAPDGRAVVFASTAKLDPADTDNAVDLYLWRDGQGVSLISDDERNSPGCPTVASSTTDCPTAVGFAGMAADASVIYLRTTEGLVDADTDGGADLYEYRPAAPAGQRLTRATGDGTAPAYPVTVTPEGTLFFISADRLGSAPPPAGTSPVLYRWKHGTITTVAVLHDRDVNTQNGFLDGSGLAGGPTGRTVRATADGDTIVFRSRAALDPANDTDDAPDLYRWRVGYGVELLTGSDPSPVTLGANRDGPLGPTGMAITDGAGRAISADGTRVFFTTTAALTGDAGDNGRPKLYEWREGRGIALVSPSGGAAGGVGYIDNSASGDDVYFLTADTLVSADVDGGGLDVYDARVGGGFVDPQGSPEPCVGDRCQGSPSPPVDRPVAASLSFVGPGNVLSPQAPGSAKPTVSRPKAVRGTRATLRVTLPGPGRVRTSGSGLTRTSRTVTKSGRYTVRVALTKRARKTLQRKRRVVKTVRVAFTPQQGKTSTVSLRTTFRMPVKTTKKDR